MIRLLAAVACVFLNHPNLVENFVGKNERGKEN
jgi:hypothetical protein